MNKEKIKNVMLRNFPGISLKDSPQGMEGSVRYWGDWQFPNEYGCEDDDDEDCDYEELTPSSRTRLAKIVGNIQKECKCDIDYDETEKNYIVFTIREKQ